MKFLLVEEDKKETDYLGEHPTPNNESNSNGGIDTIIKEFESMSSNDIINLLGIPNKNDIDTSSPMFILPNGTIISVAQAGRLIGEELKSSIHSDMIYVILKALANKHNYNCDIDGTYKYEKQKLNYLTNGLDWARLNCGETWTEKRFYCVLPNYMTSSQYRSLEKWLEWGADTGKKEVLVYVGTDEVNQTYYFNETFPEDIIKKIKRYYSSGRLYENRNELKENMNIPNDVEMFYDRHLRLWTIYLKDEEGNQISNTEYAPNRKEALYIANNKGLFTMRESLSTSMDITNEVQRAVDNIIKNKSKYKNQDDLESAIYSAVANCFSGMNGVTRTTSDMIDDVYEKELERVGITPITEDLNTGAVDVNRFEFTNYRNPDGQGHPKCKTYRSTLEYMASETERLFNKCLKTYWGATEPYKQLTIEYMNLNRHSCTRDLVGSGAEQGLKDAQSAIFKRQGELLELSKQFTKWNGKEWVKGSMNEEFVYELVPGELYHFIHNNKILYGTFKRKTPAWLFFDVEGEEVLAKPWTSVATTTEELEELIGLVNKMEKDTKVPSQVPNRFTRVPNQHNKPMGESNELKQRARKHNKKQKGMSPFISLDAGNVEKGIEVFNSSVADGSGMAMCEDMDKQTYHYEGPIYYNGRKMVEVSDISTRATSHKQAARNIIYRISKGKDIYKFDIDISKIELVEESDDNYEEVPHDPHNKCDRCGNLLNNNNECPRCDYGEYDLDESIQVDSNLDAMAQLNRLD